MTNSRFQLFWAHLLRDYATLLVLLVVSAGLSVATLDWQHPTGAAAGRQLAAMLTSQLARGSGVLVVLRDVAEDHELADAFTKVGEERGWQVHAVHGDPALARATIQGLVERGERIDAIACIDVTRRWPLFDQLGERFPTLEGVRIVQPQSYLWPDFLKPNNLLNIANQIAVIAIVAIGMTMVIIGGGIDLSVGSLIALSAVITARLIRDAAGGREASALGMVACSAAAIGCCGAIGAFTGALVAAVRIQPFIVTLAVMSIAGGLAYIISGGQTIDAVPRSISWLGGGADLFGIPNAVLLMATMYAVAHVVMARTTFGRHLYAVGGNEKAAWLCGVPVRRIRLATYHLSAALAGLGGVIMSSTFASGAPTFGVGYELQVIAAVVVGGTSLTGGEGTMLGTLLGALLIAVVQNGMNLLGMSSDWQKVVLGTVILLAAVLDRAKAVWLPR